MRQQYIRPAIIILFILSTLGVVMFPAISGWFPLVFFPVYGTLWYAAYSESDDLQFYLERHFPEFYKKHKLFNRVSYLRMMTNKEVLEQLDGNVLKMKNKIRFYNYTLISTFVLTIFLGIASVMVKW